MNNQDGHGLVVSRRAMIARIARRLERTGRTLKVFKFDSPYFVQQGRYVLVSTKAKHRKVVQVKSLEALARRLGVLQHYETLAPDSPPQEHRNGRKDNRDSAGLAIAAQPTAETSRQVA